MDPIKNNGGPAFPGSGGEYSAPAGMSLRDWFAGQALNGYFAIFADPAETAPSCERAARSAYEYADAMLAARAAAN